MSVSLRRMILPVVLVYLAGAVAGFGQKSDRSSKQTPDKPPRAETARFGDPTSTGRHLQGYVVGVLKKVGKDELILDKTEFGDAQTFKLEPKTKYQNNGKPSQLADLKVGDQVFIDMKRDKKTGDMIAKKVVTGVDPAQAR
jgi:hypothetical protein